MGSTDEKDWIDLIAKLAGRVGMNAMSVRWKLMRFQKRVSETGFLVRQRARQVGYRHKICSGCGALQDGGAKVCSGCSKKLLPPLFERIRRVSILAPTATSPTVLILTVILLAYYATTVVSGGNIADPSIAGLMTYGANFPPAVRAGEWWRVATAVMLHGGIMHLLFNLVALKQVGPEVEQVFGRGRMLFFFMITGIIAGIGSTLLRETGVGIGASGALMGLIGVMAGWGHRDGGAIGRRIRDSMINWGLSTVLLGYFIGADNAAHIVGFLAGLPIGLAARPNNLSRGHTLVGSLQTIVGVALFLTTAALIAFPPQSSWTESGVIVSSAEISKCGEIVAAASGESSVEVRPYDLQFEGTCDSIHAELGKSFGILVTLNGDLPGTPADVVVTLSHPPIPDAETGEPNMVDWWYDPMVVGIPSQLVWSFQRKEELVPGEWFFQIVSGGKVIATQQVIVKKPERLP